MKISNLRTAPTPARFALAGVSLAVLVLAACGKSADQAGVPPAAEANGTAPAAAQPSAGGDQTASAVQAPAGGLVVAAPTDVKAPPPGTVITPNPNAAAQGAADNAKAADLAKQFAADPSALAAQGTACGPGNMVANNAYIAAHGVETDQMRRFRVACMAKDQAREAVARKTEGASGGVKNTNSL